MDEKIYDIKKRTIDGCGRKTCWARRRRRRPEAGILESRSCSKLCWLYGLHQSIFVGARKIRRQQNLRPQW